MKKNAPIKLSKTEFSTFEEWCNEFTPNSQRLPQDEADDLDLINELRHAITQQQAVQASVKSRSHATV